jgi:DMSO/TMAO reductase YedYZ heme-binding membrane subunit
LQCSWFVSCQPSRSVGEFLGRQLGANPIEVVTHSSGDWALRFVLITLAITPARRILRIPALIRFRRMLGLFAFFYGALHLMTYTWFDKFFDFRDMWRDIGKRPFITVGCASLLLLIPLAVTSTAGWIRRLGGRRWQLLHRLIYLAAAGGVMHYYWLVKSDSGNCVRAEAPHIAQPTRCARNSRYLTQAAGSRTLRQDLARDKRHGLIVRGRCRSFHHPS